MIDTEETIEETRDRFDRGEKLFKLYTDPEIVKQEQIKEFEKHGSVFYAQKIREEGPIIGGVEVYTHHFVNQKKCWMCGLDYASAMGRWIVSYRQFAKIAKNREDRLFAIQNALRLRRSLTLYGLTLGDTK
jgi:hypothetical protein